MTVYLLDVNVLLALSDPLHTHHKTTHRWFETTGRFTWATCPLTENGYVRVASHPSYGNRPGDAAAVLAILRKMCTADGHRFWTAERSIRDLIRPGATLTNSQITDIYLLGLAVNHGGKLATLDRRISPNAVDGGAAALEVIPI